MKAFFDFIPFLLFLLVAKLYGIYEATAVLVVICSAQLLYDWLRYHKVEKKRLLTSAAIILLGGLTLLTQDVIFIKWKPTIVYWLIGLVLLGSQWIGNGKSLTERALAKNIALSPTAWLRLNLSWSVFFLLLGVANLYVAYYFSNDAWINFKLFGTTGITLVFAFTQMLFLYKHITVDDDKKPT